MSAFALEDGVVYHAYSTYARGLDGLRGMYQWLDRAPKGRNRDGCLVAPPRRVQQRSEVVMVLAQLQGWDLTMAFERVSQHVFLGVSALFFAATATATIAAGIIDGERRGREHVWTINPARLAEAQRHIEVIARGGTMRWHG